jgi:hypothetical protein
MTDATPLQPQPPASTPPVAPPKRHRGLLWGCGGLLALVFIIGITVAITIWWIQRPIKPVVLSVQEKAVVEAKLQKMNAASSGQHSPSNSAPATKAPPISDRKYVPGGKELRLTERELNGLLNQNTDLGQTVRLELETDAINAYVAVPIPKDFPVGGGKMFRAKGRFRMSLSSDQAPVAILEDVTVLGLSLPKEWLGGVKGKNLLADAVSPSNGAATWKGIKSLRIVKEAIVLEVGD